MTKNLKQKIKYRKNEKSFFKLFKLFNVDEVDKFKFCIVECLTIAFSGSFKRKLKSSFFSDFIFGWASQH